MSKTIVIFSTKHGSVENAVKLLKEKLGGEVTVINIMNEDPPELNEYENVILGGSIYVGKIQKQLSKYMEKHLSELLTKRIGLFICAAEREDIREKELIDSFPKKLFEHSICKEIFGYEIHYEDMNFIEKKVVGSILGHKKNHSELSESKIDSFVKAMRA
jgi:menaquinone-dependent protoporphyrinogen oxidase